jgi:hypothetical protein
MSTPSGSTGAAGSGSGVDERTREIVRIIESDHKATVELIARLTTLRAGLRTVVVTLASTVLGLTLAQKSWFVAAIGIPIVLAGYLAEARLEFLVRLAHDRSVRLERKIQAYLSVLIESGAVAQDARENFDREIDTYQFGSSRSLRGPSAWKMIRKSLRDFMTWVYVAFVIALLVSAVTFGIRVDNSNEVRLACMNVQSGKVEVKDLPPVEPGSIAVINCADAPLTPLPPGK